MRPRTGKIPHAGSSAAASFTKRRINQFMRAARAKTPAAVIASIPESRWRYTPSRQQRSRKGTTYRTGSGKLYSSLPTKPVGKGWKEVQGYQAFPAFGMLPSITVGTQLALATRQDRFGKKRQLIDIKSLKGVLNRLVAIMGLPHIGARFAVWHVGRWCLMEIVAKTPIDTGTAAAGWTISPQIRGKGNGYGRVGFRIGTDVEYVKYIEYGHHGVPPQSMMRSTFQQARSEIRNVMDVLITWWKNQQILLRNMQFNVDLSAGVPYVETDIERRIPKMSWHQLVSMLYERLPLRDVSNLNASAALAYRIDDPKNWHTAEGFKEPHHIFEARFADKTTDVVASAEVPIGPKLDVHDMDMVIGSQPSREVIHVHGRGVKKPVTDSTVQTPSDWNDTESIASRAAQLEKLWRGER